MKGVQAETIQLPGRDGKRETQVLQVPLGIQKSLKTLCLAIDPTSIILNFYFLKLFILYWRITDQQRCDSFKCTAKGLSRTYTVSLKLLSRAGCRIILNRVPCAIP